MRKALSRTLFVAALLFAHVGFAQEAVYDNGPVWRMVYYRINPGQEQVFWNDIHENFKPMSEQAKKTGVFLDYKMFLNPYKDDPEDWDVLLMLAYPNYAALDQLEAKAAVVYQKQHGSEDAIAAAVKKRNASREVVAVRLVREIELQ